jgi:hypothetical protein
LQSRKIFGYLQQEFDWNGLAVSLAASHNVTLGIMMALNV